MTSLILWAQQQIGNRRKRNRGGSVSMLKTWPGPSTASRGCEGCSREKGVFTPPFLYSAVMSQRG